MHTSPLPFEQVNKQIVGHRNKKYDPKVETITYNRYLANGGKDKIVDFLHLQGKRILLISPTGSGKTKTMIDAFEENSKYFNDNYGIQPVQIIVTPNRIQNLQNEESYSISAVVGGVSVFDSTIYNSKGMSVVADKLMQLFNEIKDDKHIVLVIDEAHDILVESIDYRSKAVKDLNRIAEEVIKRSGTVIYMTATPEPLSLFEFDEIIHCEPTTPIPMSDRIMLYTYTTDNVTAIVSAVHEAVLNGKRPLVFVNDKNIMGDVITSLKNDYHHVVLHVTSEDKGVSINYDRETRTTIKNYKNQLYGSIVEHSLLPGYTEGDYPEKVDCWLTTSMINVGTNIKGVTDISGNSSEDTSVLPIYACLNRNHVDSNMILQFFARVRYKVPEYQILWHDKKGENL